MSDYVGWRVICPGCGRERAVSVAGRFYVHKHPDRKDEICPGSRKKVD